MDRIRGGASTRGSESLWVEPAAGRIGSRSVRVTRRDATAVGPGRAIGFATIFWTWSTLQAARIGVMNDLFVTTEARGAGAADALIEACAERCRERGAVSLSWQTARDNRRAQAVYDRVGGRRSEWLDYSLDTGS